MNGIWWPWDAAPQDQGSLMWDVPTKWNQWQSKYEDIPINFFSWKIVLLIICVCNELKDHGHAICTCLFALYSWWWWCIDYNWIRFKFNRITDINNQKKSSQIELMFLRTAVWWTIQVDSLRQSLQHRDSYTLQTLFTPQSDTIRLEPRLTFVTFTNEWLTWVPRLWVNLLMVVDSFK